MSAEKERPIPALGFAAYSGTGKTTLLERLIPALRERGLRVAVIKHSSHEVETDRAGSDTHRFLSAGADVTVLSGSNRATLTERGEHSLADCLAMLSGVDLALVEGYKSENIPRIGLRRAAVSDAFPAEPSEYIALVTDEAMPGPGIPQFSFDDTEALADFITEFART